MSEACEWLNIKFDGALPFRQRLCGACTQTTIHSALTMLLAFQYDWNLIVKRGGCPACIIRPSGFPQAVDLTHIVDSWCLLSSRFHMPVCVCVWVGGDGRAYRDTTICHRHRRRAWLIKRHDLNAAHIARMALERDQFLQFLLTGFQ